MNRRAGTALPISSKGKAPIERAVLAVALPGIAHFMPRVKGFDRVADLSLAELHQRIVPDEIWHLATEVVWHSFYIDGRLSRAHFVRFSFVPEADRRAADRN